jgi:hypothetical protein
VCTIYDISPPIASYLSMEAIKGFLYVLFVFLNTLLSG